MYLSRVEINCDNLKTMRDLAHVETFHGVRKVFLKNG